MNRTVALCTFIVATAAWLTISIATPWVLSDNNTFLRGFVNHELLAFLGVLVTITLGSAAHLHLSLNQLEERAMEAGIDGSSLFPTRQSLRQSAYWLVGMLVSSIVLVITKPLVLQAMPSSERAGALLNGAAVLILLFSVLLLIDLTQMAFLIGPQTKQKR